MPSNVSARDDVLLRELTVTSIAIQDLLHL
jgi:hypothetical protein